MSRYVLCSIRIDGIRANTVRRFQQLDLTHVEDRGCFSAMEFR